ncbi:MAG: hypothetical protein KF795_13680 [Labilithrix sp.]|nr:hypothetical protein [Labilithrix sp.]
MTLALSGVTLSGCPDPEGGSAAEGAANGDGGGGGNGGGNGDGGGNGSGNGTTVTLGPDLTNEPTSAWRCSDGFPIQTNPSFPQPFTGEGAGSCTLLTFLPPAATSPGSGTAVSANVRVGAVTGPMRFVRMRILFQNGVGPKCCSLEEYGETFTPTANGTTTIPLGFTMVEDHVPPPTDLTTIAVNDLVALEVLSPTVPVPGYWPANGGAVTNIANYLWLPALSAVSTPAPSNQLLQYQGSFSGFVPLFSIAYAPNGT